MNSTTRIWVLVCGAAVVAVLAGGFFLGVQPALSAAATTSDSAVAAEAQNQATTIKLAQLSKAAAKADSLKAQNAVLLKSVPTILKPNTFIRRVDEVAALDGVTVDSVSLSDSGAYTTPEAEDSTTLALGSTDALVTKDNFASVPAVIQVTGTADAVLQFSHDIQNDERVFAIDSFQTTTDDAGAVTASLGGYIYTLKR